MYAKSGCTNIKGNPGLFVAKYVFGAPISLAAYPIESYDREFEQILKNVVKIRWKLPREFHAPTCRLEFFAGELPHAHIFKNSEIGFVLWKMLVYFIVELVQ